MAKPVPKSSKFSFSFIHFHFDHFEASLLNASKSHRKSSSLSKNSHILWHPKTSGKTLLPYPAPPPCVKPPTVAPPPPGVCSPARPPACGPQVSRRPTSRRWAPRRRRGGPTPPPWCGSRAPGVELGKLPSGHATITMVYR